MHPCCPPRRRLTALLVVGALALAGCSADEGSIEGSPQVSVTAEPVDGTSDDPTGDEARDEAIELLALSVSDDLRIVDTEGREVLLRGVNITSLGEYWQGDPDHAPTQPMTADDWNAMAAHGMSVVRLVITWSRVEPERGVIDEAYLDEIDTYVRAAAERGMYTVIDMHQDAYSHTIFTEDEAECAAGTRPGKGWDGAPGWATLTDGLSTCVTGDRNSAPAVVAAWNHFYDNTDGIRDRFVASWAAVAGRFAGRAEVAGYDLLNEPEVSRPAGELEPLYDELIRDTVVAIRDAETDAGAPFSQLVFVEPAIPAGDPSFGIVIPDPARMGLEPVNVVAAPHNYAESIDTGLALTIEETNELFVTVADQLGAAVWIGELGWWDTSEESLAAARRLAADMDRLAIGGAWWQWRQPCGDPHSIPWGGWAATEPGVVTHLHAVGCPGDEDLGPTEELLTIVARSYPRAAPGRIEELVSDPDTGAMTMRAIGAAPGSTLVVWTPTPAGPIAGEGVDVVVEHVVPGGRIITAQVLDAEYELRIGS